MSAIDDFSPTTRSLIVSQLREEILSGRMALGTRLRQAEVATRFGISTTPVREAFRELATLGLVRIHSHRGAVVVAPSSQELAQIYEVRMILEPLCVSWSAQRISAEELAEARDLQAAMQRGPAIDVAAGLNRRFHAVLAGACGNPQLSQLVLNLLDLSTPYIARVFVSSPERLAQQAREHEELLRACEQRDQARAYKASLDHLTHLYPKVGEDGDSSPMPTLNARWLPFDLKQWLKDWPVEAAE